MHPLFEKRLLIIGGKGGVGRSTVSGAIALAAARRGLTTIIAEVSGQSSIAATFGSMVDGRREIELTPGLHHVTIDRQSALEEYLREEVPGPLVGAILGRSRVFDVLVQAAPGMSELLTIGKVWELTQRPRHTRCARPYDLVVLDAPASGQLIGMLAAPQTFSSIARAGPVARQGREIERLLRDPASVGVIGVATPEQMAVSEAIALHAALGDQLGRGLCALVINRMMPSRFSAAEARVLSGAPDDPAIASARWLYGRALAQHEHLTRMTSALVEVSNVTLPFIFTEALGRPELEGLSDLLDQALR